MYCLFKSDFTFMGMRFMIFWTRCWVRVMLWRSSTLWNCWIISRLALSVLILGDRSSATSWTDSYLWRRSGRPHCQRCQCSWILQLTIFKLFQSVMLLRDPFLSRRMAWYGTSLTVSLHLVKVNLLRIYQW